MKWAVDSLLEKFVRIYDAQGKGERMYSSDALLVRTIIYPYTRFHTHVHACTLTFIFYSFHHTGLAFDNTRLLLSYLALADFPTRSLRDEFSQNQGIDDQLIDELVTAVTRVNYGQDAGINSFAGSVSLAAMSSDQLWAVAGGNKLVSVVGMFVILFSVFFFFLFVCLFVCFFFPFFLSFFFSFFSPS